TPAARARGRSRTGPRPAVRQRSTSLLQMLRKPRLPAHVHREHRALEALPEFAGHAIALDLRVNEQPAIAGAEADVAERLVLDIEREAGQAAAELVVAEREP